MVSNETPYNITSKELGLEIMPIKKSTNLKKFTSLIICITKKMGLFHFI